MSKENERLLRLRDVAEKCAIAQSSIYKWINAGKFPVGVKFNKCRRWPESEIDNWIAGLGQ